MRTKYLIIISHLLLLGVLYFFLYLYYKNHPVIHWRDFPQAAVNVILEVILILLSMTILPLFGVLMGLILKNKEIKSGFLIAALNSVVIDILVYYYFYL